ncbi:MAG: NAD-dependent epimerase/dehydratase family protein [Alphaproteobacteria bacterium]|nr:NAD-dependent epimerase/dehydratase family protein [Alphaproteobacteria bacterium]
MTSLVTGATGFVGSAVVRRLLADGESVRVLVRPQSDTRNTDGLDVEPVIGDLGDPGSLKNAVEGCRRLYHVAADYRLWVPDPDRIYAINVDGTRNLLLAAAEAGAERIVYTSSVATLGHTADGSPADEATPVSIDDMIGHYKRSKFVAEAAVKSLVEEQGVPAVIVNPSAPVGPRDIKPTPTGKMIVDAAAGRMPAYTDTGLNVVHVDDVADGHVLAMKTGEIGENYVLGGENLLLREILERIAALTGRAPPRIKLPHGFVMMVAYCSETAARLFRTGEPLVTIDSARMARHRMFFSSHKATEVLGYRPRAADLALRDAIDWFRSNGYLR